MYRIIDGYLEITFSNGQKAEISLPYLRQSIYHTPEINRLIAQYDTFRKDATHWPNMEYDMELQNWVPMVGNKAVYTKNQELQALEAFIKMCRGNRNDC